jgi:hypothetical protein
MESLEYKIPTFKQESVSVTQVPTPTNAYRTYRKLLKATVEPGPPVPVPIPVPLPLAGSRVLIWKQDPSVNEIGIRKAFIPFRVLTGPRNSRIVNGSPGIPPVAPNVFGDFIQSPGTEAFDAVHTFAVVRMTLTMYQRTSGTPVPWQWNSPTNTDPLNVFPHGLPDTINAFYSRNLKALKFGDWTVPGSSPPERAFACRSLDIVSHETGHAVLDGLKPNWILFGNPPQTGGLHESFGDLSAIFLALAQLDQVEAIVAQTKANLHAKTFLAELAEQLGLALGRPNGLRNADNDLKLSEVGNEVHAISQVFTGAIYDILADIFAFERRPAHKDDAVVLAEVGRYLCGLVLRAIINSPNSGAIFADVANQMLNIANSDGKPVQYRNFIRNRFTVREVVISPTPLTEDVTKRVELRANKGKEVEASLKGIQNRSTCCGTMQSPEFTQGEDELGAEIDEFKKELKKLK